MRRMLSAYGVARGRDAKRFFCPPCRCWRLCDSFKIGESDRVRCLWCGYESLDHDKWKRDQEMERLHASLAKRDEQ